MKITIIISLIAISACFAAYNANQVNAERQNPLTSIAQGGVYAIQNIKEKVKKLTGKSFAQRRGIKDAAKKVAQAALIPVIAVASKIRGHSFAERGVVGDLAKKAAQTVAYPIIAGVNHIKEHKRRKEEEANKKSFAEAAPKKTKKNKKVKKNTSKVH